MLGVPVNLSCFFCVYVVPNGLSLFDFFFGGFVNKLCHKTRKCTAKKTSEKNLPAIQLPVSICVRLHIACEQKIVITEICDALLRHILVKLSERKTMESSINTNGSSGIFYVQFKVN